MARYRFFGTSNDYPTTVATVLGKRVLALDADGGRLTCWSAQVGGDQYTDLIINGGPATAVDYSATGPVPTTYGPDGVWQMWVDDGSGAPRQLVTSNTANDVSAQVAADAARAEQAAATADAPDAKIAQRVTSGTQTGPAVDARTTKRYGRGISPYNFGAVGDGTTDDTTALEQFLAYITTTDVGVAHAGGNFAVSRHLTLPESATKNIVGRTALTFIGAGGWSGTAGVGLTIASAGIRWEALILNAPSSGVSNYTSRTWHTGVHFTDGAYRCQVGMIEGSGWAFALVASSGGNSTGLDIGKIKASDCASGAYNGTTHYGLTTTWSNPVNSGSSGSLSQSSTITVATLPPAFITEGFHGAINEAPYLIRLTDSTGKKRLHYITAVDPTNKKLTVFPWVNTSAVPASGDNAIADYVYGGALYAIGGDSNVHNIGRIDAVRCGVRQTLAGLYGPTIAQGTGQFCGVGVLLGPKLTSSMLGAVMLNEYFEGPGDHVVSVSRAELANFYATITSQVGLDPSRCTVVANPRLADFSESPTYRGFGNIRFNYQGRIHQAVKRPYGAGDASNQTITLARADQCDTFYGNTYTFALSPLDIGLHALTGYNMSQVLVVGTGSNGAPTQTITFNPASGWTLNGGTAAVAFSGATAAARFALVWDAVAMNIVVTKL